jgi:hypothetical protein
MRRTLKLLLAALIGTTASISANAQDSAPPQLSNPQIYELESVTAPPAFTFTAALLYLQPNSGSLEYGTLVSPLPVPSPHWQNESINPNFSPAFRIGGRYAMANANDIQANWTHLDASASSSFSGAPNQMVGPYYEIGPDSNLYKLGSATARFGYDAINIDAGHLWCAGSPFQVRLFGGLQVAHVHQNLASSFSSYNGAYQIGNTTNSVFNGVGPRLGMNAQYNRRWFQLVGEAGGSVLIGQSQARQDYSAISPVAPGLGIPQPNNQSLTSPNATQVVPCLDARLGAAYVTPATAYGIFRVEAGYQAAVYINAVSQYSITGVVLPPAPQSVGVFLESAQHLYTNFMVQGPYVSGSWLF